MITPDPNRRIEWDDFFNHKLFDNYQDTNQPAPADMRQSVMFRNHEDRVNLLFKNNKKTIDRRVVDLIEDPRKIKLDLEQAHRNDNNRDTERIIEAARRRYTHEKKVIVFMMHTCRRLRNLAKQRAQLGMAANGLMFVGLLLLKKGILLNNKAEETLERRVNSY